MSADGAGASRVRDGSNARAQAQDWSRPSCIGGGRGGVSSEGGSGASIGKLERDGHPLSLLPGACSHRDNERPGTACGYVR